MIRRAHPQSIRRRALGFAAAAALAAGFAPAGCGGDAEDAASEDTGIPYPASLGPDSSPSDVAKLLIEALEADDEGTLVGLVAAKAETANLNAIFERRGREGNVTPPKAAALAAAGWSATYSFLKPGQTRVRRHEIHGDKADVFATAVNRGGETRTLKIEMIREDGAWKVLAGLENLPD